MKISKKTLKKIILEEIDLILEQSSWGDSAPPGYFDYLKEDPTKKKKKEKRKPTEEELKIMKQGIFYSAASAGIKSLELLLRVENKSLDSGGIRVNLVDDYGFDNLKRGFSDNCLRGIGEKLVEWRQKNYPTRKDYDEYDRFYNIKKGQPGYEEGVTLPKGHPEYEALRKDYIKKRGPVVLAYRKYRNDISSDIIKLFGPMARSVGINKIEWDSNWGDILTPESFRVTLNFPTRDEDIGQGKTLWDIETEKMLLRMYYDAAVGVVNTMICFLNDKLEGEWDCGAKCTNV